MSEGGKHAKRLQAFAKILFLVQGLLLQAVGIKDVITYNCRQNVDIQCTRLVHVTWLLIGFATVHLISAIFSFFYSCATTIYQPLICLVLWSACICSLVFHHLKQSYDFEAILSTKLAISLAIITTYAMLMLAEIVVHVNLLCLQQREASTSRDYELVLTASSRGS